MRSTIRVGLIGDFSDRQRAHLAIPGVLAAASESVECAWIPSDSVRNGDSLMEFDGLWCVPGMPYRSPDGVLRAIRLARTSGTPFLGTSAGFQYALIEYARNVAGLTDADHEKTNPRSPTPVISRLPCALAGVKARVHFTAGSRLRQAYESPESVEEYHCSFALNSRYERLLESRDLYVAAVDDQEEVRAVELDGHPFFVATLFQPELRGLARNPLVTAFVSVCERRLRTMRAG